MKLVANLRRLFELQILRVLHHLRFQLVDLLLQRLRRERHDIRLNRRARLAAPLSFRFGNILTERQNVDHFLIQPLRNDTVLFVVRLCGVNALPGLLARRRR